MTYHPVIIKIHNDDIAVTVDGQGGRPFHFTITGSKAAKRPFEGTVRVEHVNPVVFVRGYLKLTAAKIYVPRSLELSMSLAFLTEFAPIIALQIKDFDFVNIDVDDVDFVLIDF